MAGRGLQGGILPSLGLPTCSHCQLPQGLLQPSPPPSPRPPQLPPYPRPCSGLCQSPHPALTHVTKVETLLGRTQAWIALGRKVSWEGMGESGTGTGQGAGPAYVAPPTLAPPPPSSLLPDHLWVGKGSVLRF